MMQLVISNVQFNQVTFCHMAQVHRDLIKFAMQF